MRCSPQQFPGNYRALTSKPASWGAQSSCCCPQTRLPLRGLSVLETARCHLRWFNFIFDCVVRAWRGHGVVLLLAYILMRAGESACVLVRFLIWNTCQQQLDWFLSQDLQKSHHIAAEGVFWQSFSWRGPSPPAIINPDLKFTKIWGLPPVLSKWCVTLRRSG